MRAYYDGRQVCIELPRGIGQGEMPPLFVVGPEGNTSELVNYRVRGNHMIVDRLFAAAELRFGSGDHQKRVRITRTDGRPRSEEHTSELQSLMRISYAVFCLKKKNDKTHN